MCPCRAKTISGKRLESPQKTYFGTKQIAAKLLIILECRFILERDTSTAAPCQM